MKPRTIFIAAALAAATLAPSCGAAQDQGGDNLDDLFNNAPDAPPAEAKTIENPEGAMLEGKGLTWGGELTADALVQLPYTSLPPGSLAEWTGARD